MKFTFYDTETTGLWLNGYGVGHPEQPRVVSLSALLTEEDGEIVDVLNLIFYPNGFVVPEEASAIHGITTEIARKEGIPALDALEQFANFVKSSGKVVAYNESYDNNMVRHESKLVLRKMPFPDRICAMLMATGVLKIPGKKDPKDYSWPKLEESYRFFFGKKFENAHNSLADVHATRDIYFEMKKRGIPDMAPRISKSSSMRARDWFNGTGAQKLRDIVYVAKEDLSGLNNFQQQFMQDMIRRHEQYEDDTFVSQKQWDILFEIESNLK